MDRRIQDPRPGQTGRNRDGPRPHRLWAAGLSPLLWLSQPRAASASRDTDAIVLRDETGQTTARLVGEGQADPSGHAGLPPFVNVEFSHRRVAVADTVVEAGTPRSRSAALGLDLRSVSLQFRAEGGAALLDEYKAFREDGTPLCIVTFGDVQVKAAQ